MTGGLSKDDANFITNLYNELRMPVMKVIRLNCFSNQRQDHEDILHDVFLQAVKSINTLKSHSKPSRWLYKTALNLTFKFNRNYSKNQSNPNKIISDKNDSDSDSNNSEIKSEQMKIPDEIINSLQTDDKELYILRYRYNFSYKEIADILHISESNVGVRLHRLTRRILELFKNNNLKES